MSSVKKKYQRPGILVGGEIEFLDFLNAHAGETARTISFGYRDSDAMLFVISHAPGKGFHNVSYHVPKNSPTYSIAHMLWAGTHSYHFTDEWVVQVIDELNEDVAETRRRKFNLLLED